MSTTTTPHAESSATATRGKERTLADAMREPSVAVPAVVVLDEAHVEVPRRVFVSANRDLWLSTVDGRHQSPIIPVRCGPEAETFYVHKDILTKSEFFRNALDGRFREAGEQAVDLPEEDPALFSFVVAYLYEGKFSPIKPAADALVVELPKGKGREGEEENEGSESGSGSEIGNSSSDDSMPSERRLQARHRRQQRNLDRLNRKEPGRHRLGCNCPTCFNHNQRPPCWNCGVQSNRPPPLRRAYAGYVAPPGVWGVPPPPPPMGVHPPHPGAIMNRRGPPRPHDGNQPRLSRDRGIADPAPDPRMDGEDMRTWLMAYELSVDVYICAERYCLDNFKACIRLCIIDYLETAGMDAAQPLLLECCRKLHAGLSSNDVLLKMVFARVGFMLARLWKNYGKETHLFWMENAEVGGMIMKETMERREMDAGDDLPAMSRVFQVGREVVTMHR